MAELEEVEIGIYWKYMSYNDDLYKKQDLPPEHYYGDYVRKLFLAGGAIMILTYPFFYTYINLPLSAAVLLVLVIVLLAGFQSPTHPWIVVLNTIVSVIACGTFEYKATTFYLSDSYREAPLFFWMNQLLTFIFFIAAYYSAKSARGMLLHKNKTSTDL